MVIKKNVNNINDGFEKEVNVFHESKTGCGYHFMLDLHSNKLILTT